MTADVNHISFEGVTGFRFTDNVISLWLNQFQDDIHFSLSINKDSPDINFHVTREVNNTNNKPKNVVFVIERNSFNDLLDDAAKFLLHQILSELNINEIQKDNVELLRFIPHDDLQQSEFYFSLEEQWKTIVANVSKFSGKKRLRINNNLTDELESLSPDKDKFIELYNNAIHTSKINREEINSGIIISGSDVYSVAHFNGKWYVPKKDLLFTDFVNGFFGNNLGKKIVLKTQDAIEIVRNANSFDEIKHLNNPFRIVKEKIV